MRHSSSTVLFAHIVGHEAVPCRRQKAAAPRRGEGFTCWRCAATTEVFSITQVALLDREAFRSTPPSHTRTRHWARSEAQEATCRAAKRSLTLVLSSSRPKRERGQMGPPDRQQREEEEGRASIRARAKKRYKESNQLEFSLLVLVLLVVQQIAAAACGTAVLGRGDDV